MRQLGTIHVMGGAREAHSVIAQLLADGRRVVASLPEPERMYDPFPVPTRTGAFRDQGALEEWFQLNQVTCVIDASHSFDADISEMVSTVCSLQNLRYVRLLRPPWRATHLDHWTYYPSVRDAAIAMPENARCFSNTGRGSLPHLADFTGERLFLRQTQEAENPPPFPFVRYIVGTPPFSQRSEETLFQQLRITCLMCRDVGGVASMSKLLAARRLGLPVSMIDRSPPPAGMPLVETVADALAWEANL